MDARATGWGKWPVLGMTAFLCLSVRGQEPPHDGTSLDARAASVGLPYPLEVKSIDVATNTGSMVINALSSVGTASKIGFDANPRSKDDRWTFVVGSERLARGSREETTVLDLLSEWVRTNVPPDLVSVVAEGRYTEARKRLFFEGDAGAKNSLCLRLLDMLVIVARERETCVRFLKPESP